MKQHLNTRITNKQIYPGQKNGIIDGVAVSLCDMRSYCFGAVTTVAGPSMTMISFYYNS